MKEEITLKFIVTIATKNALTALAVKVPLLIPIVVTIKGAEADEGVAVEVILIVIDV